ncbi:IS110 family transposase [Actinomadura graeca]|uniref:IS110 family transposase n=1 Tax=Actinomadura graeca TaxID=2750812 RepID=A0ABX8R3X8_9ACTN|nr:IS110 family transposase [Actinomadura graeca]QXJ25754.1 IS110 family transposase [Actinomadura graeca]
MSRATRYVKYAKYLYGGSPVNPILGAQILGRLGEPNRFTSLAGVRVFSGLVPRLDSSGLNQHHGGLTKSGDACLREALFLAAEHARRTDPSLAAKYHRPMATQGKHHTSALCHVATTLLTRIAACWRRGEHYTLRDATGQPVTREQARTIIAERYTFSAELRAARRTTHRHQTTSSKTGRPNKESQHPPPTGPSTHHAKAPPA